MYIKYKSFIEFNDEKNYGFHICIIDTNVQKIQKNFFKVE